MKKLLEAILLFSSIGTTAVYSMTRTEYLNKLKLFNKKIPVLLKVDNQTNKSYIFKIEDKILPIGKKSSIKKIDLTPEWKEQYKSFFMPRIHVFDGDDSKLILHVKPGGSLSFGKVERSINALVDFNDTDIKQISESISFNPEEGSAAALITVILMGDNLEQSEIEVSAVQGSGEYEQPAAAFNAAG